VLTKNCTKQFMLIAVLSGLSTLLKIFHFVSFGGFAQGAMSDFYFYGDILSVAAAISGVLLVAPAFKELYNRQFADVEFSLPMSASERFRAKLLVILKCHFIPFAVAQSVTVITGIIFLNSFQMKIIIFDVLCHLVYMAFTDAIALVCVSSCGNIVECIYTPIFLAAASSLIIPLSIFKFVVLISGRNANTMNMLNFPVGYPGAMMFIDSDGTEMTYAEFIVCSGTSVLVKNIIMLIADLAVCVGLVFLALRIYKKRNGLTVGKPFVSGKFYRIFISVVTVAVILEFFLNSLYIAVFVGLLLFLAISVSANRTKLTMKVLEKNMLGFCGCLLSVLVIGFVSYITCGFGYTSSPVNDVFDSDATGCQAELITSKYLYRIVQLPQKDKTQEGLSELPEYRFCTKEMIDQIFKEITSLDKRNSSSFSENLSNYFDLVRYENVYDEFFAIKAGTVYIMCSMEDDKRRVNYYDNYSVRNVSDEDIEKTVQRFLDLGYEVYKIDPTGKEDDYLMKEQRYMRPAREEEIIYENDEEEYYD